MDLHMKGKVAFVTGAGQGLGKAVAEDLAREGAKVVLAEINEQTGMAAVEGIKKAGGSAAYFKCDVTSEESVIEAVRFTVATYGKLDYAFNNCGVSLDFAPITEVSTEHWDSMIAIGARGAFYGMKHQIPEMLKNGGGSIVNTASTGGLAGNYNMGAYNAMKHALIGVSRGAALDFADKGIRINVIVPGSMNSEGMKMKLKEEPHFADPIIASVPIKRLIEPEEVSKSILFLLSDQALPVVGSVMVADGGFLTV